MKTCSRYFVTLVVALPLTTALLAAQTIPLDVMVVFAHPDEGEIYTGGTTALYTSMGHRVKFLSLTNGDAGHYSMQPAELAKRRYAEAMKAKEILKLAEYRILDYHDAKLTNTEAIQKEVAGIIRDWDPDVVYTYYPAEGGHNDNMTAGWIVRDAVKFLDMETLPVFFYIRDYHTTSFSYVPDFAVIIDDVWQQKLASCGAHESQVIEANPYAMGILDEVLASKEKQREFLFNNTYPFSKLTYDIRLALEKWHGKRKASQARYAEAFEIAEFGRQVRQDELASLIPTASVPLTISGKTAWLDTGIDVKENTAFEIEAVGEIVWKSDGRETCGPAGANPSTRRENMPLLGAGTGALIGKVGEASDETILIGDYREVVPHASGRLYLGINDDNLDDNDGAYRVWIHSTDNEE